MRAHQGLRIQTVSVSSPSGRAGLKPGDVIITVQGQPVEDELDFSYLCADRVLEIEIQRRGIRRRVSIERHWGELIGLDFFQHKAKQCTNRCIFCFIDQMPPGLRRSLYIKDEDYRYSFLNGNYLTLCATTDAELQRIVEQGISPLYISVHATDPAVRTGMLRNRFAGRIMTQLRQLEKGGIAFHAQIVVCPGYNDGSILRQTIRDLLRLRKGLRSCAVVPVGLTKYRSFSLQPVDRDLAVTICRMVEHVSDRDRLRCGSRRLFLADEFFMKAGLPLPGRAYYEDYPQIGNGVGLIRQLCDEWLRLRRLIRREPAAKGDRAGSRLPALVVTSKSAEPFLTKIVAAMSASSPYAAMAVLAVVNRFFGPAVTVSGLLTGGDVIRAVRETKQPWRRIILPASMINHRGYTLDGYSLARISVRLNMPVFMARSVRELFEYGRGRRLQTKGVL
jgi:putative radical SAM enzyme (TIGR03279 family)